MFRKMIRLFNSLIINNIKFLLIKLFHFKKFSFKFLNIISPLNSFDIQDEGKIILHDKLNIPSKSIFGVREKGILEINDGSFINNNCQIISHKKIAIGKNVCIGPNTIIMDHDHVFGKNGVEKKIFKSKEIIIEDNAWIGANCVILKGARIGKNSVVAAGSIVNCDVPENSILIQKKENEFKKINI